MSKKKKKINGKVIHLKDISQCQHRDFDLHAVVNDITEKDEGPVVGRCLSVSITCAECGVPFAFEGLPAAKSHLVPSMTTSGLEARLPISPSAGEQRVKPVKDILDDTVKFTVQKDE